MYNPNLGSFEETFGDNRGNDALFFLDDDNTIVTKKQEPNNSMTCEEIMNELDLLSSETLDKDSIEKNLSKLIDWFKTTSQSKMEETFLKELPERLNALFLNMKDQVKELDYNATGKLKIALKNISEVDTLKKHFEEFDKEQDLRGEIEGRFKDLVDNLRDQSKKIKKQKNLEKRKKLYDADKQDRIPAINKGNAMLEADDKAYKSEVDLSFTKSEYGNQ